MNEPVAIQAALAAAINATLGLLSLFGVSNEVVGGLQIVAGLWIVVIFLVWVRPRVTPTSNVKMTVKQYDDLVARGYQPGKRKLNPEGDLDGR